MALIIIYKCSLQQNVFRSSASLLIERCHRLTHVTFRFFPLIVDRFGRSLRFCHLEFDKEAISDAGVKMPGIDGGF